MSIQSRLESLVKRHKAIEAEVLELNKHPGAESPEVTALKKLKLRLKDEMSALQTRH